MGLKAYQKVAIDDINFRLGTAESRGILVCLKTDQDGYAEKVTGSVSGKRALGVLLMDTVDRAVPGNIALGDDTGTTTYPSNMNKNETHVSGVVRLLRQGELITDQVVGSPTKGATLYLAVSGKFSTTQATGAPAVGHALEDMSDSFSGFLKVFVNCV